MYLCATEIYFFVSCLYAYHTNKGKKKTTAIAIAIYNRSFKYVIFVKLILHIIHMQPMLCVKYV